MGRRWRRLISWTIFSPPLTDQGCRRLLSAVSCCVAVATAFIVTVIYGFRMTTAAGRNTGKRRAAATRSSGVPGSPATSILPSEDAAIASGYCSAICCRPDLSTALLSRRGAGAKRSHLPFACNSVLLRDFCTTRWNSQIQIRPFYCSYLCRGNCVNTECMQNLFFSIFAVRRFKGPMSGM